MLHYWNYKWLNRQPDPKWGVIFQPTRSNDSLLTQTVNGRAVPYVVALCYDVVVCSGDGFGNCIGNYRYYTECTSSTYWIESFDYASANSALEYPDPRSHGGGGGSGNAATYLFPPSTRIANLAEYLQCFNPAAPGRLIVYVDQPLPGSDEPFTITGRMGHVFISLEQTQASGVIRRFIGFHPGSKVNPFGKKSAPSTLANDHGKNYDLFLPITLSVQQFQNVISAVSSYPPLYDLEKYNWTDFAIDIAQSAGIQLPRSSGWWIFGQGSNPGRFGEDLRHLPGTIVGSGKSGLNVGVCK